MIRSFAESNRNLLLVSIIGGTGELKARTGNNRWPSKSNLYADGTRRVTPAD